jgi:hypothetical protein
VILLLLRPGGGTGAEGGAATRGHAVWRCKLYFIVCAKKIQCSLLNREGVQGGRARVVWRNIFL